ncbi:MAG: endolytic transglycosylase MltG [Candidatus Obscuribacterales bacterium]|nr:endolytic transglycosylase MltG [Steroidobacteraceae bacterium]
MRKVIFIVAVLIGLAVWVFYSNTRTWLYAPIPRLTAATIYEVPRGAGWTSVVNDLHARGVVEHPRELSAWLRYVRPKSKLKAGEYELKPGLTPVELIELLQSGRVLLHALTVVEGSTFSDFRRSVYAHKAIKSTTQTWSAQQLMQRLGATGQHPEGRFFPDTYKFAKGTTDIELLQQAHRRMQDELDQAWAKRDPDLLLVDATQALILASIVEKETALASERPMIAGVFAERLKRGMRLQTDPTVIYGMGERYNGNIRRVDLLRDTPYNTYTRAGLPPTPICLPGADALQAAVRPHSIGAIFFVATGNADGSHHFSKTLAVHNAAVQRFLKVLRQRQ